MEILKRGSKGDAVKQLQNALIGKGYNLVADGDFGTKTESAVKDFQKKNNLTVDGLVGNSTLKALGIIETTCKAIDESVIYNPLNKNITKYKNRPIKYIAIHYTAGVSSVQGNANKVKSIFINGKASADFAIDDKDIVQLNPDIENYYCWSVGDSKNSYTRGATLNGKAYNRNTINIELCSTLTEGSAKYANHVGWEFSDETLNNAIKLCKILMKKYNIPANNVVRHYDITGKLCPGIYGWNNGNICDGKTGKAISGKINNSDKWIEFKNKLMIM